MCGCNSNSTKWKVKLPNGKTILKNSKTAATLAQAKYPGSTIEKA
jgi:hypothetical protein